MGTAAVQPRSQEPQTQAKSSVQPQALGSAGSLGPFQRQERSGEPGGGTLARPPVGGRRALDSLQRRVGLVMIPSRVRSSLWRR